MACCLVGWARAALRTASADRSAYAFGGGRPDTSGDIGVDHSASACCTAFDAMGAIVVVGGAAAVRVRGQ